MSICGHILGLLICSKNSANKDPKIISKADYVKVDYYESDPGSETEIFLSPVTSEIPEDFFCIDDEEGAVPVREPLKSIYYNPIRNLDSEPEPEVNERDEIEVESTKSSDEEFGESEICLKNPTVESEVPADLEAQKKLVVSVKYSESS